jgi:GDP-L-fucose synthase
MKIWVTGSSGSLGKDLVRELKISFPESDLITPNRDSLNLLNAIEVDDFVQTVKPSHVFHLAAVVYGIFGHKLNPEECLLMNSQIDHSIFSSLFKNPPKWIFYASTVATYGHPFVNQTLKEEDWLIGFPHSSEYGYAMAKRFAISYLEILHKNYGVNFSYGLLTNLFGPEDRYLNGMGHVIVSLLEKSLDAKRKKVDLDVWGSDKTSRDFLATSDAARILVELFEKHTGIINVASGEGIFISEIAKEIVKIYGLELGVNFSGENEGITQRLCSIDKLIKFSAYAKNIDSRLRINEAIFDFGQKNLLKN